MTRIKVNRLNSFHEEYSISGSTYQLLFGKIVLPLTDKLRHKYRYAQFTDTSDKVNISYEHHWRQGRLVLVLLWI